MKRFFVGILSLAILFILCTVSYASEPRERIQMYETPSKPEVRRPQSSEYLANCAARRITDSSLTFGSSSDESSFIQVYEEDPFENEESEDTVKFTGILDVNALFEFFDEPKNTKAEFD